MTRAILVLLALTLVTPGTLSQQLPPPENPDAEKTEALPPGPPLFAPQNAPQPPAPAAAPGAPAEPAKKKNAGKPPEFFAALRKAQRDRKQARIERMRQFKAARAAEDQKLYQDWHERYLADTPVRVEYYRALAAAYESQPAFPYYGSPYVYVASPVIVPVT